jgi:FixJ family two-component response regulator
VFIVALAETSLLASRLLDRLGIAETTVNVHRSRAILKMNARSLPKFGRMADKLDLVPVESQRC